MRAKSLVLPVAAASKDTTTGTPDTSLDGSMRSFSTIGDTNTLSGFESIQHSEEKMEDSFSQEADVVLYVGGKEFDEHSFLLRNCSDYFDTAITKNLMEGVTWPMYFDFPHRDPNQWDLIRELIRPFPRKSINLKNLKIVLPWMEALGVHQGMEECDHVLFEQLGGKYLKEIAPQKEDRLEQLQAYVHLILDGLVTAADFQLTTSKGFLVSIIKTIVPTHPVLLQPHDCGILAKLMDSDDECRRELWPAVVVYLPEEHRDTPWQESKALLEAMGLEAFQKALYFGIKTHLAVTELSGVEKRALSWLRRRPRRREEREKQKLIKEQEMEEEKKEEERNEAAREIGGGFGGGFDLEQQLKRLQQLERL